MRQWIIPLLATMTLLVAPAQADDGLYGSIKAGGAIIPNISTAPDAILAIVPPPTANFDLDFSTKFVGSVALGYQRDKFMFEAEAGYNNADFTPVVTGGAATTGSLITLMANGYFSPQEDEDFQPYLGAGVGLGLLELGTTNTTKLAFQAIFGARYRVSDQLYVGVEYRYLQVGTVAQTDSYQSHVFMGTVTIKLGDR